jgi:NAD(P)-dependent dehydrogenase (short-subunit alcohol dehydrogenase family)
MGLLAGWQAVMLESREPPMSETASGIVHRLDARVALHVTRLKGKVALVTGGGSGIGRGIALAFAREGAKVAVLGRRREPLDGVVSEMRQNGSEGKAVVCDVTQAELVRKAVEDVEHTFARLNVLVNNAGMLSVTTVESISEEEWDRVLETNLKGPFLVSRAVLPAFRRAGGGAIVNIGSVLGLVAMKNRAAYCASKGGMVQLTKAMALDHAHENIRVNCICPAIVETELVKKLFDSSEAGQKARDARIGTLPLGRFGKPEDVAELAVFLACDESAWLTGTAIPVDGGLSAY